MTLQKITTDLQTHCHEGHSNSEVVIKILDAYYKVGKIKTVSNNDKTLFVIEAGANE